MAFGTPVAGTVAYSASGGTSVAPTYPASIVSTDQLVLILGQKPSTANSGTATTPSGWTLREELTAAGGYGTTLAADSGNTNLRIYTKNTVAGGESGTVPVTLATNNVSWAFILRVPTGGGTISYGSSDGQDTTAGSVSVTLAANPGLTAGDIAIWAMCIPTDVTTPSQFSAHAISAAGATFATPTEINEPDSGNGNDIGGFAAWTTVSSGTATAAPTITATAGGTTTNVRGPLALLRMREALAVQFDAQPGSFTATGQTGGLLKDSLLNAESGGFTITGQDATFVVGSALQNYEIDAQPGAFDLTGQTATTLAGKAINAQVGSLTVVGQAATLLRGASLNAQAGSLSISGQAATITATRSLPADAGSYVVTGQDAQLLYDALDPVIDASAGSFALTGANASLSTDRVLSADAGSLTITGQDATLSFASTNVVLDAQPAAFTVTGADASLLCTRVMPAAMGRYGIGAWADPEFVDPSYASGLDATFLYGRVLVASAGSMNYAGLDANLQAATIYPDPAFVQEGVQYGPGGIYTGTLKPSGGGSYMRRR